MKQIVTTSALAIVLLAGAGGAALGQEQHDRGGGQPAQPQGHPGGPGGHFQGAPGGQPGVHPGNPPGGGHAPVAPQGGPPHQAPFQGRPPGGPEGGFRHDDRAPGAAPDRHFQSGGPGGHRDGAQPPTAGPQPGARPGGHFEAWGVRPGGAPPHWSTGRYPPVMAWNHDRFRPGAYRPPPGYYVRAWGFGDVLPRPWFARSYWLLDFLDFDLPYPPPGFVWVRVGSDALLVDEFTGRVVQVVRGIFW